MHKMAWQMNRKTLVLFFIGLLALGTVNYSSAVPSLNLTQSAGQTTPPLSIFDNLSNMLFRVTSTGQAIIEKFIQFDNTGLTTLRNYRLPDSSGTIPVLNVTQTFTGANTFSHNTNTFTATNTGLIVSNPAGSFATTLAGGAVTANRTLNMPAITGADTLASLGLAQTFTGANTFSSSTTINGVALNQAIKTGAYTLMATDNSIWGNTTTAGFTVTLPDATTMPGKLYAIKKIDPTTNILKIGTTSSQQINDVWHSYNETVKGESIIMQSDGIDWHTLARDSVSPTAQLSSTVSEAPTNTTANVVIMNSNDYINGGITHSTSSGNNQNVVVNEAGIYFIVAAGQIGYTTSTTTCDVDLWLRDNGVDIPNSNTRGSLILGHTAANTEVLVSQSVLALNQGDTIKAEFSISVTGEGCGLVNTAPAGEADIPAIIFSITKISDR